MGSLSQYYSALEEDQSPEVFLGSYELVESRVAAERACDDVEAVVDIHSGLEALCTSMESALEIQPWVPVFINHALNDVNRRTGLKIQTVSMEDAGQVISLEGLGESLKKVWDAIVSAVKAALKAVADFFRRIYDFITGKKSKIESGFKQAKEAGDATPAKLASENTLDKVKDKEVVDKIIDKLENKDLAKARPSDLVIVTPSTATVIDRAVGEGNTTTKEQISHKGKDYTVIKKQDVAKAQYIRIANAGNDFISHASLAGVKLQPDGSHQCRITIDDLTELVWETLFRAKTIREVGAAIVGHIQSITNFAMTEFKKNFVKGGMGYEAWKQNEAAGFEAKLLEQMQPVFAEFKKLNSNDGKIPEGRRVTTLKANGNFNQLFWHRSEEPALSRFTGFDVMMEIPTWSEVKKASDGITSLMVMSLNKLKVLDINTGFESTLKAWNDMVKAITNAENSRDSAGFSNLVVNYCKVILTATQNHYNSFLRSQMVIEGNVVQFADQLAAATSKLADSKNIVGNLA